tara:strand:+ start:320 stop:574 length:255 start_codon:yes stop_codon:yes gene_type:complete
MEQSRSQTQTQESNIIDMKVISITEYKAVLCDYPFKNETKRIYILMNEKFNEILIGKHGKHKLACEIKDLDLEPKHPVYLLAEN